MESKRKIRKVRKAVSAQAEVQKPPKVQTVSEPKPPSPESLIHSNGLLIEELFLSKVWTDIAFPLLQESIAGVSGRFTNGRYWHGDLTTKWNEERVPLFIAGYQKALMDFHNNLHAFILKKNETVEKAKQEDQESKAPIVNPFMEDEELED